MGNRFKRRLVVWWYLSGVLRVCGGGSCWHGSWACRWPCKARTKSKRNNVREAKNSAKDPQLFQFQHRVVFNAILYGKNTQESFSWLRIRAPSECAIPAVSWARQCALPHNRICSHLGQKRSAVAFSTSDTAEPAGYHTTQKFSKFTCMLNVSRIGK